MINKRTLLSIGAAGVALLSLGSASAQQPPVKIAAIVPISGAGAFDGQLALEGMQAMAEVINQ
jgi:branched-chain amino acid transport system substrate-binding protein